MARVIRKLLVVVLLVLAYFGAGGIYLAWHRSIWGVAQCRPVKTGECVEDFPSGMLVLFWPITVPFTFGQWAYLQTRSAQ